MHPAIFLDRDGVIIENVSTYVRSWDDVFIFPQALSALMKLKKSEYKLFVVTNQSAIGRGIITWNEAQDINMRLVSEIEKCGGRIDQVFICPHSPQDHCSCRKPKPGLIVQAQAQYAIDLQKSILIGDALTDLIAGKNAGIGRNILLLTGRGKNQFHLPSADTLKPFPVYQDLEHAVQEEIDIP